MVRCKSWHCFSFHSRKLTLSEAEETCAGEAATLAAPEGDWQRRVVQGTEEIMGGISSGRESVNFRGYCTAYSLQEKEMKINSKYMYR